MADIENGTIVVDDIDSPAVDTHLSDYRLLPLAARKRLRDSNMTIYVGNKPVNQLDELQDVLVDAPRGWAPGSTWDSVAGVRAGNKIVAGATEKGHGSRSLLLHEVGHGLDELHGLSVGGMNINYTVKEKWFLDAHERLFDGLQSYYQQGGPRGRAGASELFAEATARILSDEPKSRLVYDDAFVNKMLKVIKS